MTREEVRLVVSIIERELMKLCDDVQDYDPPKEIKSKINIIEEFGEKYRRELFEAMDKNTSAGSLSKKEVYSTFGEAMQKAGSYKDIEKVETALSIIRGFVISVSNPYASGANLFDECSKLKGKLVSIM